MGVRIYRKATRGNMLPECPQSNGDQWYVVLADLRRMPYVENDSCRKEAIHKLAGAYHLLSVSNISLP